MLALLERWWRAAGLAVGALVLAYCVAVSADLVGNDLFGQALGPVTLAPNAGDAAGDAGLPSADADFTLPVPTPLEDDRVVAAFAPLVNLSCKRSDYANPDVADLPAADAYVAAESAARERALAAPIAPSAAEIHALMTQHLFASGRDAV